MNEAQITAQFSSLFVGRQDAWGALHGECKEEPVTRELWHGHLFGRGSLGIYPLTYDASDTLWVHWGCVDIDEGVEMLVLARNLWKALKVLGISSWVERSKGKGYHVWVLTDCWVPAEIMRNALLLACQVAGVRPKEVNPKQTTLDGLKGYGNYVNLPYAKQHADMAKRVVLDMPEGQTFLPLETFVADATKTVNQLQVLEAVAAVYVPPPPPKPVVVAEYDGNLKEVTDKLTPLAWTVFTEGPMEGSDRSSTLGRLAHMCRESGLDAGESLAVLVDADSRWGKFSGRPDGLSQLEKLVRWAYQ